MSELRHRTVRTNGIDMHVAEQGEGRPVVLCHGFPELWYSWRHQIPALAAAGYHVVAPDQRGYGGTDRPSAIDDYDIIHLTDDLLGLLDAIGEERAVFVGHDWGAPVVWNLALRAPERVEAVVGMSVSFTPRPPSPPTELFRALFGDNFFYILHFQEPGVADAELGRDPEATLRRFLYSISGDAPFETLSALGGPVGRNFFDRLSEPPDGTLPPWLTPDDLAYFADAFSSTGFTGGINWYRNFDRNWELTSDQEGAKIDVPCLMVTAEWDPVLTPAMAQGMDTWIADLETHQIARCGHWTQQEQPDELNRIMLDWLGRRFPT